MQISIDKYEKEIFSLKTEIQKLTGKMSESPKQPKSPIQLGKNLSVHSFNNLPLNKQQLVVSKVIKDNNLNLISPFKLLYNSTILNINDLLLYLMNLDISDDLQYFNIKTRDIKLPFENLKEIESPTNIIIILSDATEILYQQKKLKSSDFISCLKKFSQHVSIEVKLKSPLYEDIYKELVSISKNGMPNLRILITISGYRKTDCSFKNNKKINYININNVIEIGGNSFEGCSSLKQVTFSDDIIETIGASSFFNCASLKFLRIPSSVTSIGSYAFCRCSKLTDLTISASIKSIEMSTFEKCSSLSQVKIPDSVVSIGNRAFAECTLLSTIDIPFSVTSIGESAFTECSSLEKAIISDSVTSIGKYCFYKCKSLVSVKLSDSITSIEESTFEECDLLSDIKIPESVDSIGDKAFFKCYKLSNLAIKPSITFIGSNAFSLK